MGRRGKPPLAGLVHMRPLRVHIEAKRMAAALGGLKLLLAGNDKAKARHALNAFIG